MMEAPGEHAEVGELDAYRQSMCVPLKNLDRQTIIDHRVWMESPSLSPGYHLKLAKAWTDNVDGA